MKKGFLVALMMGLMVLAGGNAFAAVPNPSAFYLYMTDSNGGTNIVSDYTLGQQPWLRMHFPEAGYKIDVASWGSQTTGATFLDNPNVTSANDVWLTLNNWNTLTPEQKAGSWKVDGSYSLLNIIGGDITSTPAGKGMVSFNVAPEPISATLFLLGGAGLAVRRFTQKRKV